MNKLIVALSLVVAGVSAFAPHSSPAFARHMNLSAGKYDGKLWDNDAKKDVYNSWDPNSPRSEENFNPFETWEGNSPDCSGYYPGEGRYKDPMRGDVNFAIMMAERAEAEERAANPKAGDKPGCPGCRT